jgi:hypothetical protein
LIGDKSFSDGAHNPVRRQAAKARCQPWTFEITDCDLKLAHSSSVNLNGQSPKNRLALRCQFWFTALVVRSKIAAKSASKITD